jgi:hypothetical protein
MRSSSNRATPDTTMAARPTLAPEVAIPGAVVAQRRGRPSTARSSLNGAVVPQRRPARCSRPIRHRTRAGIPLRPLNEPLASEAVNTNLGSTDSHPLLGRRRKAFRFDETFSLFPLR